MWDEAVPDEMELARVQSLEDAIEAENTMVSEAILQSKASDSDNVEVAEALVLSFNHVSKDITGAICESEFAQTLRARGVDVCPQWANGATILVEGLTPSMMEASGFAPEKLRRSHVVVRPQDEIYVEKSLMSLTYRKRPREKTRHCRAGRQVIAFHQHMPMDMPSEGKYGILDELPEDLCHTEGAQGDRELPEDLCCKRTFIDVAKKCRVGWSPRSFYTKSSNDADGIENPRRWMHNA